MENNARVRVRDEHFGAGGFRDRFWDHVGNHARARGAHVGLLSDHELVHDDDHQLGDLGVASGRAISRVVQDSGDGELPGDHRAAGHVFHDRAGRPRHPWFRGSSAHIPRYYPQIAD